MHALSPTRSGRPRPFRPRRPLHRLLAFGLSALLTAASAATAAAGPQLLGAAHPLAHRIWDTRAERFVSEADVLAAARAADVVLLGETHDNPIHHAVQARLYAMLAKERQAALALEPFDRERQADLDAARPRGADALRDAAQLARGWDWDDYRTPVAEALAQDRPVRALNLSREAMRGVVRGDFSVLPADARVRLALDTVWDVARDAYLYTTIIESHCNAIDEPLARGLVRAQRLRDASMADALLAAPAGPITVLLGRGHARLDVAVPRYLAARAPATRVLSVALAEVEDDKTRPGDYLSPRVGDAPPFDYLWLTPRAERPDPCDAFKPQSSSR